MVRSSPARRAVSAAASAVFISFSAGLLTAGAAVADAAVPLRPATGIISDCEGLCLLDPGDSASEEPTEDPERPRPSRSGNPPETSAPPAPPPAVQDPASPAPAVPTTAPEPAVSAVVEPAGPAPEDTAAATATPSPTAAATTSAPPSTESNWNAPVIRSAKSTQAAAVSPVDRPGRGTPEVLTIMAGVLLVGAGGICFRLVGQEPPGRTLTQVRSTSGALPA